MQRLAQGRLAGAGRCDGRQVGPRRYRRGQRGKQSLLRAADRDFRRRVRQDRDQQRKERPLARGDDAAGHGAARRRQLHRGGLDRRNLGQYGNRGLRHVQGRRPPLGAQPGGRVGPQARAGQRHRARPRKDRICAGAVGRRETCCRAYRRDPATAPGRAARHRRYRCLSRLGCRRVCDRAGDRRRRRGYHPLAMDLNYSQDELAFRDEVRAWLQANLPKDLASKVADYEHLSKEDLLRWHKILAKQGWVAPAWPKEWGGTGWNVVQRYIFEEELGYVGGPPLIPFGLTMCAAVLLQFGTEAQKKRFLPRIYNGEDFWCQGYSEPGSGSDLASLKTRAVREGDSYKVTGQKIWTTLAHYADWIFCLVRTDPANEKRQEGISFLLIDMKTPGITVRPLILMDGGHEVNEVFFDDVKGPVENLVHQEGKGWTVAKYLLGHERMNTGRVGESKRQLAKLKAFAAPRLHDMRFRDRLSRLEVELMALEITNLRFLDRMRRTGQPPGADVSMLKIKGTEIQQGITELMMQAADPAATDEFTSSIRKRYLSMRKTTIYAGSNEIQRNIIAKMTLGL